MRLLPLCALGLVTVAAAGPRLELLQAPVGEDPAGPVLGLRAAAADFSLEARFECGAELEPVRLFVSIADSAAELATLDSPARVTVRVPAAQLAGVRATERCAGAGRRLLAARLLAHGTLVCRGDDERLRASSASAPLGYWLECPAEATGPPSGSAAQPLAD